eukprot:6187083-Pleurochrysis_carterae.AAC.1
MSSIDRAVQRLIHSSLRSSYSPSLFRCPPKPPFPSTCAFRAGTGCQASSQMQSRLLVSLHFAACSIL